MRQGDEPKVRHKRPPMPMLDAAIVDACCSEKLAFDELYSKFCHADPCAAAWLRDETEYLAPAAPAEKEKYALLALKLHYMLCKAAEK
jgi:hypothetical protein